MRDVMRQGADLPVVSPEATVAEATREISRGGIGIAIVIDTERRVVGVFTDGDLRRAIVGGRDLGTLTVADVMTRTPRTISADKLTAEAVEMMEKHRINQLPVIDAEGILIGALNMHDLFRAKAL